MAKVDHEKIIAEHLAAYQCANLRPCPSAVTYERGWFCLRRSSVEPPLRYRAAEIKDMTDRLRARAAEREQSK
jgi:hypothetical protein